MLIYECNCVMSMQINMIEKKIVCFIINIMKGKRFVIALNLVQQVLWVDWKLTYKKQDSSKHVYSLILKCTRWLHFPLNSLQNCFDILVIWTFVFNSVVQTIHFVDVTMKRTRRYYTIDAQASGARNMKGTQVYERA